MALTSRRTCDSCGEEIVAPPHLVVVVQVVDEEIGKARTVELDFHSYAHLIAWAQAQPEPA